MYLQYTFTTQSEFETILVSTSLQGRSFHCLPHILRITCFSAGDIIFIIALFSMFIISKLYLSAGGTIFIISKLCLVFFLLNRSSYQGSKARKSRLWPLNLKLWNCVSSRKWNPCQIDLIQEGDEDQFEICSAKESRFEDGCLTLMQTQPPSFTQRFLPWEKVQTNLGETPKKYGK